MRCLRFGERRDCAPRSGLRGGGESIADKAAPWAPSSSGRSLIHRPELPAIAAPHRAHPPPPMLSAIALLYPPSVGRSGEKAVVCPITVVSKLFICLFVKPPAKSPTLLSSPPSFSCPLCLLEAQSAALPRGFQPRRRISAENRRFGNIAAEIGVWGTRKHSAGCTAPQRGAAQSRPRTCGLRAPIGSIARGGVGAPTCPQSRTSRRVPLAEDGLSVESLGLERASLIPSLTAPINASLSAAPPRFNTSRVGTSSLSLGAGPPRVCLISASPK